MKSKPEGKNLFKSTRRQILQLGAGAAGVTFLTGRTSPLFAQSKTDHEGEVVFASNGGSQQTIFEEKFFPEFTRQTGINVVYLPGQPSENVAKAKAQRADPSIDVIWSAGAVTYDAIDDEIFEPLDLTRLSNYARVRDEFKGEERFATVGTSSAGMVVNSDRFTKDSFPKPTSWFDFWDPRFKGHVGLYSVSVTAGPALLALVAQELTGSHTNMESLEKAIGKFKELTPNVLGYYTSSGAWETAIQQGDLWIGLNSAVRTIQLKLAGMPIDYPAPKEGHPIWASGLGIVTNCKHPNAAHALVNYMLSQEFQRELPKSLGYSPVNIDAKPPEDLAPYFPPMEELFLPDWRFLSANMPAIVNLWNREVER